MDTIDLFSPLVALQFAVLVWRVEREIRLSENHARTWLPVFDLANLISYIVTIFTHTFFRNEDITMIAIRIGFVLLAFYPLNMMAHYGIARKDGRQRKRRDNDYRYLPDHEVFSVVLTVMCIVLVVLK